MTCEKALELLEPALEQELANSEAIEFEEHMNGCSTCAAQFAQAKSFVAMLEGMPSPEPPIGLAERVKDAVRSDVAQTRRAIGRAWGAGAGVLAVAAALVYFLVPGGFARLWADVLRQFGGGVSAAVDFTRGNGQEGLVGKFADSMPPALAAHPEITLAVVGGLIVWLAVAMYRYFRVVAAGRSST